MRTKTFTDRIVKALEDQPELLQSLFVPVVGGLVPLSRQVSLNMAKEHQDKILGFAIMGLGTGETPEQRLEMLHMICVCKRGTGVIIAKV